MHPEDEKLYLKSSLVKFNEEIKTEPIFLGLSILSVVWNKIKKKMLISLFFNLGKGEITNILKLDTLFYYKC